MIRQSMSCVTGNHERYPDPTSPIISHLWGHLLLFWIYHLHHCVEWLGSRELLIFLEERYLVAVQPGGWTLQVLPALSQVIRLDRRILKDGLSLLYAVITVKVAPVRQLPSLRVGADAVGARGHTYTHVTVLDMIYIFQRSLLGDSYFPPQLALITWRGALELWGPNVDPDEVADDTEELATEARETMNEALLKFTILLDFTTPLQIPKLHVSKQTALQLRSRAVHSIREVVVCTEDTKPARAYQRPPTPGPSRPPILPTIEEILQLSCPCSSPEATTPSPAMSDEDRARKRRVGKQRCVCVGLEGPSSW
ncbi:hypothetical protein FA13DRAFT_815525 [Coprinellus micaceus]|uniref:Uncharacterized protein n=1 Tax=Coprinellus micaceus TaxID=71717 RepID=A0A4Y7T2F2_COPMI|nr:hypothetical protein FA13DRAFT_815525 [Coprinellus micaceus]